MFSLKCGAAQRLLRRILTFLLHASLVLAFMMATNSRQEEPLFWVSRRLVAAGAVYLAIRFLADSFTKRGPDSD